MKCVSILGRGKSHAISPLHSVQADSGIHPIQGVARVHTTEEGGGAVVRAATHHHLAPRLRNSGLNLPYRP